jgi:hypothetical protein
MAHTFGTKGPQLIADNVSPGNFGGFITWDGQTRVETIYAVDRDSGTILVRADKIGCNDFDGNGWTPCDFVPDHAEWIGNYPAPKARAVLNGTRIVLKGKIGGFQ